MITRTGRTYVRTYGQMYGRTDGQPVMHSLPKTNQLYRGSEMNTHMIRTMDNACRNHLAIFDVCLLPSFGHPHHYTCIAL